MADSDLDDLLAKLAAGPRRRPPLHMLGTKRFELRRQLGSGTFGDVYEARDREYGTLVALKSLKSSHPDWIYRFKREFRIVGDLAHPNLVRLYELFLEDERWYLTMELVDGLRLDEHVRRAPGQLRSCFGQLALGILELHRASCLHRDLKPSNALVEPTGRVVLLDFGLAVHQRATRTSAVAGTPPFMAPELGLGQPPSAASDWYSFGVMLYEALAGQLPFTGSDLEILNKKLGAPPPRPSDLRGDVDPVLEVLAMQLLARGPGDRPGADDILRALVGSDVSIDIERERTPHFVGRRQELAALADALATADDASVLVTVRGQPGLGKTSLVGAFLDASRGRAQVYQGRCLELESVPFKGVDGAIDMLCNDLRHRRFDETAALVPDDVAALAQMFPMVKRIEAFARSARVEPRARSPQEVRQAAFGALRQLVGKLAARQPVVVFDDDLQWSGRDSMQLLLELLRAPARGLVLIVAYRQETAVVAELLAGAAELGVRRVDLAVETLDSRAVAELLAAHDTQLTVDEALRETLGHPYLLTRLLERGAHIDGPIELASVLAGELTQLDRDARALLELVAVAGGPISQRAAFAAAELRPNPATVDQLRRRRLVHATSTADARVEAYHDRVREIALAGISGDRRRGLHLAIANALEHTGVAEAETLARHYRAGLDRERALTWTRRAAQHATDTFAFDRAVELHADAVALADNAAERFVLLDELTEAQVQAGRRDDAGTTQLEAAELAASVGLDERHAEHRARAGEQFLLAGQLERGLALLRDAMAAVGVSMPISPAVAVAESFNLGGALATRGLGFTPRPENKTDPRLVHRVDLALAVARALLLTDLRAPLIATRALLDALEAGESVRVQRALSLFVLANSARSPEDDLVADAEAVAGRLADQTGDDIGYAWYQFARGMRAIQRTELTLALDALGQAERTFLAGSLTYAREATLARVGILTVCGNYCVDLAYAHRHLVRVEQEALARGDLFGATWTQLTHCFVALSADDVTTARAVLKRARGAWPHAVDSLFAAMCLIYELAIEQYTDLAGSLGALARIEPEFRQLFTSLIPFPRAVFCRSAASTVMAAWQAGALTDADARQRIDHLAAELDGGRSAFHFVVLSFQRGLARDHHGRIEMLERAAADWDGTRQPALALTARLRAAQFAGDAPRAAELTALLAGQHRIANPDRFAVLLCGPGP